MPNRAYEAGDRFEKRVAAQLEVDGYEVWQSRGSKGPADLVALKKGQSLLVQVKAGVTILSHDEWNGLYELARSVGAEPIIADRAGQAIRFRKIVDCHVERSHAWAVVPWSPDYARRPIA